jgi:hypothetical protein
MIRISVQGSIPAFAFFRHYGFFPHLLISRHHYYLIVIHRPAMARPSLDTDLISTGHSAFLKPALQQAHPARSLILRGINLSSSAKFPHYTADSIPDATDSRSQRDHRRWMRAGVKSHEPSGLWDEAESGGHEGWFNGAPFPLDEADVSTSRSNPVRRC